MLPREQFRSSGLATGHCRQPVAGAQEAADQPTMHRVASQQRLQPPGVSVVLQLRNLTLGLLLLLLKPYCEEPVFH